LEIRLVPPEWATHLISDLDDWHRAPRPVGDLAPFDLPDDAWFEYAWLDADGVPRSDPTGVSAANPWWEHACRLAGPAFREHPDVPSAAAKAEGRLERHKLPSSFLGSHRWVFLYSTAGPSTPGPLVLFQDGKACWHHGRVGPLADALTRSGAIPPAHFVFLQPEQRSGDYVFNPAFRSFVSEELIPFVEQARRCTESRVAWGVSLGALASAWLALDASGLFQTVVAQSGAFLGGPEDRPHDPYGGSEWLLAEIRAGRGGDLNWSLDCGTLEWLQGGHRRLIEAMTDTGCLHRSTSRTMGHNWQNWRQGIPDALRWALAR